MAPPGSTDIAGAARASSGSKSVRRPSRAMAKLTVASRDRPRARAAEPRRRSGARRFAPTRRSRARAREAASAAQPLADAGDTWSASATPAIHTAGRNGRKKSVRGAALAVLKSPTCRSIAEAKAVFSGAGPVPWGAGNEFDAGLRLRALEERCADARRRRRGPGAADARFRERQRDLVREAVGVRGSDCDARSIVGPNEAGARQ